MHGTLPLPHLKNATPDGWKRVERPLSLFRRFQFQSYSETRDFLDRLAALSEEADLYPDLGFGTKHVNVTIHAFRGNLGERETEFASRAGDLTGETSP
jgi:pterin-4a-carbinolamine dehydratase